jgi:hypothetical protein
MSISANSVSASVGGTSVSAIIRVLVPKDVGGGFITLKVLQYNFNANGTKIQMLLLVLRK